MVRRFVYNTAESKKLLLDASEWAIAHGDFYVFNPTYSVTQGVLDFERLGTKIQNVILRVDVSWTFRGEQVPGNAHFWEGSALRVLLLKSPFKTGSAAAFPWQNNPLPFNSGNVFPGGLDPNVFNFAPVDTDIVSVVKDKKIFSRKIPAVAEFDTTPPGQVGFGTTVTRRYHWKLADQIRYEDNTSPSFLKGEEFYLCVCSGLPSANAGDIYGQVQLISTLFWKDL